MRTALACLALCLPPFVHAPNLLAAELPEAQPPRVADRQRASDPGLVRLEGGVGGRIDANITRRLAVIDLDRLLEGYRHRPGRQAWDGEHIGKWLHAASLAWRHRPDPALRAKLDTAVAELIRCQEPDGYLGTYLPAQKWTSWDVWAHKYNLLGLISYMHVTGNPAPLASCRKMADLLVATFGTGPGQRDILRAGEHVGMAPTSVLEPMVLLYRLTGEPRYLEFCRYILQAWEFPQGPHIFSRLQQFRRVDKVGNAKAYEMLSCLNGALEFYRTTGESPEILTGCRIAWEDIVARRLYPTGTASYHELFHDDFDLPSSNNVGETCVTVTWLQFNQQLLRLTGEARFAEELEKVVLNQLLGAQKPDGTGWGYYVEMAGTKPYSSKLDGHCCLSSGPRGLALVPTFAVAADREGLVVNLYENGQADLSLPEVGTVRLKTATDYPAQGTIRFTLQPAQAREFALKLRVPAWCKEHAVRVNDRDMPARRSEDGYLRIRRTWQPGDRVDLTLRIEPRVLVGTHVQEGRVALAYGPLVLAADTALLAPEQMPLARWALPSAQLADLKFRVETAPPSGQSWPGRFQFRVQAVPRQGGLDQAIALGLVPFADAGGSGSRYQVWMPIAKIPGGNLFLGGKESRSRAGNLAGFINDDPPSLVCTFDGSAAQEDWYAIQAHQPVRVGRIVFRHGAVFHNGGWFDTSAGPPRVQVQRSINGPWESIGTLDAYPKTTATRSAGLKTHQAFTLRLETPLEIVGVRVVGVPAHGDNPKQAFSSCAGLEAFAPAH